MKLYLSKSEKDKVVVPVLPFFPALIAKADPTLNAKADPALPSTGSRVTLLCAGGGAGDHLLLARWAEQPREPAGCCRSWERRGKMQLPLQVSASSPARFLWPTKSASGWCLTLFWFCPVHLFQAVLLRVFSCLLFVFFFFTCLWWFWYFRYSCLLYYISIFRFFFSCVLIRLEQSHLYSFPFSPQVSHFSPFS